MEDNKGDDLGLPQENLKGDEPMADVPAPDGLDMPAADAPLDDLDFEPLDMPQDGLSDEGALIEGVEPGEIDPDMLSPDPLAETAEFVEPDADGLLSPEFPDDEAAPVDFEPDGLGFPMDDESISDAEPKADDESKADDEEPEEVERLEAILTEWRGRVERTGGREPEMSEDDRRALEAPRYTD